MRDDTAMLLDAEEVRGEWARVIGLVGIFGAGLLIGMALAGLTLIIGF